MRKRKESINNFRFYPIFQKRRELKLTNGNLIEDYVNKGYFPSSYKVMSAMEASMNQARRIEAKVKIMGRYPGFFPNPSVSDGDGNAKKNGDRLFYTDTNQVLRISDVTDPTNRQEYIHLICHSGAYTTRGTVQPSQKTILKMLAEDDDEIINMFAGDNDAVDIGAFHKLGNFDQYYKPEDIEIINDTGSKKNAYILINNGDGTSNLDSYFDDVLEISAELSFFTVVRIKEDVEQHLKEPSD